MNRRHFIKRSATASVVVTAGSYGLLGAKPSPGQQHITVLHTNDTHSHIDPFPPTDPRNANRGGAARRATLIKQIRDENPNTLLLDAGDIFQGTPYFNFYGGELEFKLMSMMDYDAATLGNHDFDNGVDGLLAQLPHAKFDFLISNYDLTNTILDGHTKPWKVYGVDGVRVGVFGLGIELKGLVNKSLYRETRYLDPIDAARDSIRILREEQRCDLVICLSHLGHRYDHGKVSDIKVAEQTAGIDLIIGGHTHTFLKEPEIVQNQKGEDVLINQVGFAGLYLGRIDFYLDAKGKKKNRAAVVDI